MEKRKTKYSITSSTRRIGYIFRNERFCQQKAQKKISNQKAFREEVIYLFIFLLPLWF